jgi:acetylglutamate kinase
MKRVIKIGGRAQASSDLPDRIGRIWHADKGSICIVHGGGDQISEVQRRTGLEPTFVDGRRITTREDIEIIRMVLSGLVNKKIVSSLVGAGIPAVGVSGEDTALIAATPIEPALGRVGKPVSVKVDLIEVLLNGGYLPVISPVSAEDGVAGEALNVNGDDAAAAIAIGLCASELLLIVDVSGVMDADGNAIKYLDQTEAGELIHGGVINKGMRAKLEAGFAALAGGVSRVRISNLEGADSPNSGTILALAKSLIT